ncbi:MAG: cytochrome-c peroxidase [Gammaproteobacteria bacterium]
MRGAPVSFFVAAIILAGTLALPWFAAPARWTDAELSTLRSLQLDALPPMPPDPSNAVADSEAAAHLGHRLFFDTRLSADGSVSCASCHQPDKRFTDGLATAQGLGRSARNAMSIVGAAYSPWYYWDGRKDSQWSQALAPLEDPAEHGTNRMRLARLVTGDSTYRRLYEDLFGTPPDFSDAARFPADAAPVSDPQLHAAWKHMRADDRQTVDRVFANLGKALAAYERRLMPGRARFDDYVASLTRSGVANGEARDELQTDAFTSDEAAGLRLFIGRARCVECHNGPLFTNNEFHNTGLLPPRGAVPDRGRARALEAVRSDAFNCLGAYSDAEAEQCSELRFMRSGPELLGAMRTPSLRNLGGTAPYMHKGQMPDLAAVLAHYNAAPQALIGHNEAEPLGLSRRELQQLEAFLLTLDAPLATDDAWLIAPTIP